MGSVSHLTRRLASKCAKVIHQDVESKAGSGRTPVQPPRIRPRYRIYFVAGAAEVDGATFVAALAGATVFAL